MKIAAIIVGIDGWEQYTEPLIWSIYEHEPSCHAFIVDNASPTPYPTDGTDDDLNGTMSIHRMKERACYSKAINYGKRCMGTPFDWYIVLSNDVLCTGPFAHLLEAYGDGDVVGPKLLETPIPGMGMVPYIEGWCMCFSRRCWDAIGGFDENYLMSSFEDVDASHEARKHGFGLIEDTNLPFVHLDQRQRFYLPGYGGSEAHNMHHFMQKNGVGGMA